MGSNISTDWLSLGKDVVSKIPKILGTFHSHGRFANDGVFTDDKMPLQYRVGEDAINKDIAPLAEERYNLAKLVYEHKSSSPDGRYQRLGDEVHDANGLCAAPIKTLTLVK